MPTMNLEKLYTSPYRSFNFQQLFFYDIFLRNAYFTTYELSVVKVYVYTTVVVMQRLSASTRGQLKDSCKRSVCLPKLIVG